MASDPHVHDTWSAWAWHVMPMFVARDARVRGTSNSPSPTDREWLHLRAGRSYARVILYAKLFIPHPYTGNTLLSFHHCSSQPSHTPACWLRAKNSKDLISHRRSQSRTRIWGPITGLGEFRITNRKSDWFVNKKLNKILCLKLKSIVEKLIFVLCIQILFIFIHSQRRCMIWIIATSLNRQG